MQKLRAFMRHYKFFSLALVSGLVGLGLYLLGYQSAAKWLISLVALVEATPLLNNIVQDVRSGSYGINILAITAIVGSVFLGQYWAALVIVLTLTGGVALENYAERQARGELDQLLRRAPKTAHLFKGRRTVEVHLSQLKINDKILIKPGELVPVDAVIIDGTANFDESSLTGENFPVAKMVGAAILSGSSNSDGMITARVTAISADSHYQQIIKLVQSASAAQSPFVRLAERYSIPFTIAALAIAGVVGYTSHSAIRFLEIIIVATPCPLILAAPIALLSGMSRASKYGILVKTGSALERLAKAETIAFGKTGTLTSGLLTVDTISVFYGHTKDEIVKVAASLAQSSNHVVAQAIINYAENRQLRAAKAKHVKEIAGLGLLASLHGKTVLVGRLSLLQDNGVNMPPQFKPKDIVHTAVYVAIGGDLAGVISFKDEIRADSLSTLERLRRLGLKRTILVTGDNTVTAKAVAKSLNIQEVHAEAMPADKLRVVDALIKRPVVFVGDGVTDASVMTAADIGIALGSGGTTIVSESADIVIVQDNISRVATAYAIATRTFSVARKSILIGIGLSLSLMALFATGKFSPLTGALVQEVVGVVVIFNALRARTGKI